MVAVSQVRGPFLEGINHSWCRSRLLLNFDCAGKLEAGRGILNTVFAKTTAINIAAKPTILNLTTL